MRLRSVLPLIAFLLILPASAQVGALADSLAADTTSVLPVRVVRVSPRTGVGFGVLPLRSVDAVAALLPGMRRDFATGAVGVRAFGGVLLPRAPGAPYAPMRDRAPVYVVDGVRALGAPLVPFGAVEAVEVLTDWAPASVGEAGGGVVLVETEAGGPRLGGRLDALSSAGLDAFGYDVVAAQVSGPLGGFGTFSLAGEGRRLGDALPYGGETYRLSDEAYADLLAHPQVVRATHASGETRYLPFPADAAQAAFDAGRAFTVDDLRAALTLPDGFDIGDEPAVLNAPGTYTADRFERVQAKDAPLGDLTLQGRALVAASRTFRVHVGGTLFRQRAAHYGTPVEQFANSLYNRDALYDVDRDAFRVHGGIEHEVGTEAAYRLRVSYQTERFVEHPSAFSDRLDDALRYGDIDDDASAVARRYVLFDAADGTFSPLYAVDGSSRPTAVTGGTFVLPGRPATRYRRGSDAAFRVDADASVQLGVHALSFGGAFEQQAHRYFALLDGASLARYAADEEGPESTGEGLPEGGVTDYSQLPFFALDPVTFRYGYDYLGLEETDDEDVDAFLNRTDTDLAPYRPIYYAGFVRDRIAWGSLSFDAGLRVEAFDHVALALLDPYALGPIIRAGSALLSTPFSDQNPYFQSVEFRPPAGVESDWAVYFNDDGAIVGYRDLDGTFYDRAGTATSGDDVTGGSASGQVVATTQALFPGFQPEARSEAFTRTLADVVWEPRFGVRFSPSERGYLFSYFSRIARRPPAALYAPFSAYDEVDSGAVVGNANLRPTVIDAAGLGGEAEVLPFLTASATMFYRRYRDLIGVRTLAGGFPPYRTYVNEETQSDYGVDLTAALTHPSGLAVRAAYSVAFARGTGADAGANTVAPDLAAPADVDVRHALDVAGVVRIPLGEGPRLGGTAVLGGLSVGAVFAFESGRPYTALVNPGAGESFPATTGGGLNEARLPSVHQLDLRLDKQVRLGPSVLTLFAWVENVLDTRNVLAVYRGTGRPDTDGFLASAAGQHFVNTAPDSEGAAFNYGAFVGGPVNVGGNQSSDGPYVYGLPRRVRLGLRLGL